ncbi:hypothetical protein GCM10007968_19610 [Sporolactobacillus putidus]|uniref:Uncharacterized protein n=1 Tax=Sporolactobacillus putidus TaxID=492735 RepID=A0A917S3C6_9BACL|nr:hypothetical protein GCM10007968_19610 [Sporolactobacillus putidus]
MKSKHCGLGPVGFPAKSPDVAIQAVSFYNSAGAVTKHRTGTPLRPHSNPFQMLHGANSLGDFLKHS